MKLYIIIAAAIVAIVAASVIGYSYADKLTTAEVIPPAKAEVPVDAMGEITTQVVNHLTMTTTMPDVQRENIRQAEHLVFGKPVILETAGVPDTVIISDDYDMMTVQLKGALQQCADLTCNDPTVAAEAKELLDRITYWQETKENLEVQTADLTCDVNNPATCLQLDLGDEPQAIGPGITVGTDKIWDGWYREIRSPYAPVIPYWNAFGPNENIIPLGPMAAGECSTVVKEIQGIKSIQRPVKIPIWQEPWTSRATIIGFTTVWVVDFVPAEFVKSLNYCNNAGTIDFDYRIDVIIERELTHFWKYLPAGVP